MFTTWLFAALHLFGLGVGLGAVWGRFRALRGAWNTEAIRRALYADSWWAVAALIWITTGLERAFGGLEKGSAYYLHNHYFHLKMGCLIAILLLEIWPIVTLTKWRGRLARGIEIDSRPTKTLARISLIQAHLIVLMVLAATAMARGYGAA